MSIPNTIRFSCSFVAYYYLRYTMIEKTIELQEELLCQRLTDFYAVRNNTVRSIPFDRIEPL